MAKLIVIDPHISIYVDDLTPHQKERALGVVNDYVHRMNNNFINTMDTMLLELNFWFEREYGYLPEPRATYYESMTLLIPGKI